MKVLLVVGDDKTGRKFLSLVKPIENMYIVVDKSTSTKRVWKLIKRGSLTPFLVLKMALAELMRPSCKVDQHEAVRSNGDLLRLLKEHEVERVYLFRAGLLISKRVLKTGVDVLNIHCARIPEYGGLGVLQRALNDKAYDQEATLHRVTTRIDEGEVLATQAYQLDGALSYRKNEDAAYEAGMRLLLNQLSQLAASPG